MTTNCVCLQINRDPTILPNVTLGAEIRDDCLSETVALDESLNFILNAYDQEEKICSFHGARKPPVAGVVGTGSSQTSLPVASLLRLFRLPQVSYAATSPDLNKRDYEYFTRTVPSDDYQAEALLDIIGSLNWTAVFLISSSGNYGRRIREGFIRHADNKNLCIVDKLEIGESTKQGNNTESIIDSFLEKINQSTTVRGVVMLTTQSDTKDVLRGIKRTGIHRDRFVWLGSDTWGTEPTFLEGVEAIADGAVAIAFHNPRLNISNNFYEYFAGLRPGKNSRNPWFDLYWEIRFKCNLPRSESALNFSKECTGNETLSGTTDDKLPYILDSVYALALSLDYMLRNTCSPANWSGCVKQPMGGDSDLLNYLKMINFSGASGMVRFDRNGSGIPQYDIVTYTNRAFQKIAVWREGKFLDLPEFYEMKKKNKVLGSTCTEVCEAGEERTTLIPSCCSSCDKCDESQYVDSKFRCRSCEKGNRVNQSRTGCESLPEGELPVVVAVLGMWGSLGILVVALIAFTMCRFYSTPIVMASGRELMLVLLAGIAFCYILGLSALGSLNARRCTFQRFGSGVFFAVCYSAILVKTNRIARIFHGNHRPAFITPAPQLLITALLVSVQLGICVVISIVGTSSEVTKYYDDEYVYVICRTSSVEYLLSISYNVLLMLLCTFYGFRTRKLPANFNEAKEVGWTMYATCVLWICFLPLFYGTSPVYQTTVLLLNSCFNSTVLLIGIFGSKVYVVWLQPEKNTRQASNPRGRSHSTCSTSVHEDDIKNVDCGTDKGKPVEVFTIS